MRAGCRIASAAGTGHPAALHRPGVAGSGSDHRPQYSTLVEQPSVAAGRGRGDCLDHRRRTVAWKRHECGCPAAVGGECRPHRHHSAATRDHNRPPPGRSTTPCRRPGTRPGAAPSVGGRMVDMGHRLCVKRSRGEGPVGDRRRAAGVRHRREPAGVTSSRIPVTDRPRLPGSAGQSIDSADVGEHRDAVDSEPTVFFIPPKMSPNTSL
jgi:hypothetical protein